MLRFAILTLALSACAMNWQTVGYTPKKLTSADPKEVAKVVILSNSLAGCVSTLLVTDIMLNLQIACPRAAGTFVVRFDQVASIGVLHAEDWFLVRVTHKNGLADFELASKIRADVENLADAFMSLAHMQQSEPSPSGDGEAPKSVEM